MGTLVYDLDTAGDWKVKAVLAIALLVLEGAHPLSPLGAANGLLEGCSGWKELRVSSNNYLFKMNE
jgi:hypothetical protein